MRRGFRSPGPARTIHTRRFHNAQVYISQQPVKCLYGSRGCLSCGRGGRGMILFNRILYYIHRCIPHRTGMSLLALSSIFVAPYRSSLTPFEVVTPRRVRSLLQTAKLSEGICRVSARKGGKGKKRDGSDTNTRRDKSGDTCKSVRAIV